MTLHPFKQAIWRHIWKYTVEKSQTNAACVTLHPLMQALWRHIRKCTEEKSKKMQPVWICIRSSRQFGDTFDNTHWRNKKNKCIQCNYASFQAMGKIDQTGEFQGMCDILTNQRGAWDVIAKGSHTSPIVHCSNGLWPPPPRFEHVCCKYFWTTFKKVRKRLSQQNSTKWCVNLWENVKLTLKFRQFYPQFETFLPLKSLSCQIMLSKAL